MTTPLPTNVAATDWNTDPDKGAGEHREWHDRLHRGYQGAVSVKPNAAYAQANSRHNNTAALPLHRLHFLPVALLPGHIYTALNFRVTTAAASVARMGWYRRFANGEVGELLDGGGTVDLSTAGVKTLVTNFEALDPTAYIGVVVQGTASATTVVANNNAVISSNGVLQVANGENQGTAYVDGVTGDLPLNPPQPFVAAHPTPVIYYS